MRKSAFCICENKDADQLRGDREADQRLCFRYTDSTITLLPKSEISSFLPSFVAVQPVLFGTWSETPKTGFLTKWLILGWVSIFKCAMIRMVSIFQNRPNTVIFIYSILNTCNRLFFCSQISANSVQMGLQLQFAENTYICNDRNVIARHPPGIRNCSYSI